MARRRHPLRADRRLPHPARGLRGERAGFPRAVLRNRLLGWLGVISFGIYLWHLPIMAWLANDILERAMGGLWHAGDHGGRVALAVGSAAASYYVVERPLLRAQARAPARRSACPEPSASAP